MVNIINSCWVSGVSLFNFHNMFTLDSHKAQQYFLNICLILQEFHSHRIKARGNLGPLPILLYEIQTWKISC